MPQPDPVGFFSLAEVEYAVASSARPRRRRRTPAAGPRDLVWTRLRTPSRSDAGACDAPHHSTPTAFVFERTHAGMRRAQGASPSARGSPRVVPHASLAPRPHRRWAPAPPCVGACCGPHRRAAAAAVLWQPRAQTQATPGVTALETLSTVSPPCCDWLQGRPATHDPAPCYAAPGAASAALSTAPAACVRLPAPRGPAPRRVPDGCPARPVCGPMFRLPRALHVRTRVRCPARDMECAARPSLLWTPADRSLLKGQTAPGRRGPAAAPGCPWMLRSWGCAFPALGVPPANTSTPLPPGPLPQPRRALLMPPPPPNPPPLPQGAGLGGCAVASGAALARAAGAGTRGLGRPAWTCAAPLWQPLLALVPPSPASLLLLSFWAGAPLLLAPSLSP